MPIVVVVHMPTGYTAAFANRLDEDCALRVVEASDGLALGPGLAVIARAGSHLHIGASEDGLRCRLDLRPIDTTHRPSVDVLFRSLAPLGSEVVAVVLTGMGDDGAAGARELREAGGTVLAESESSCVVYGMPRVVKEAGLVHAEAPIEAMADLIAKQL